MKRLLFGLTLSLVAACQTSNGAYRITPPERSLDEGPIAVYYLPAQNDITPNVRVECISWTTTLEDYVETSLKELAEMGLKVGRQTKPANGTWTYEAVGKLEGTSTELHYYSKVAMKAQKACTATGAAAETSWKQLGPNLSRSVDSFEIP